MLPLAAMPPPKYWGEIDRVWSLVAWPLLAMLSAIAAWLVARAALKRYHSNNVAGVYWSALSFGLVATIPSAMFSGFIAGRVADHILERTDIDLFSSPWDRRRAIHIATEILTRLLLVPLFSALATAGLLAMTRGLWSTGGPPAFRVEPGDPTGANRGAGTVESVEQATRR